MSWDGPRFQPPVRPEVCSHHAAMVWEPDACWCEACGQRWEMGRTASGQPAGWVPVGRSLPG